MLTFPTQAEKALARFRAAPRTTAIERIAKGADKVRLWDRTEYTFDDDSVLVVRGRGRNHQVTTQLP